jgi:hypothetical protein
MTAIIKNEYNDSTEQIATKINDISIEADGNTLFNGRVTKCSIRSKENVFILEIEAKSYSYFMDIKKKCRSFQDKALSYEELFTLIMKEYGDGYIYDDISKGKKIPAMLLQYDETDWEFVKRLASHFYGPIYQEVTAKAPVLRVGFEGMKNLGKLENYNFCIKKDIEKYEKVEALGNKELIEQDAISYEIESYENYELGSNAVYQDNKLFMKEKQVVIEEGILIFHYKLTSKNGLAVEKLWNERITGLSLTGEVLNTDKDYVKVHLCIDEKQEESKAKQLKYTTMYAATSHAGWYCMPEKGDIVNVYFPSKDEQEAVSVNSIRENESDLEGIDTSTKLFRTADGKEIKFTTDAITITSSNSSNKSTGERDITYIELKEKEGIHIFSTKPVTIQSDDNLELIAKKKLLITANEEISITCKTSRILVNDRIDLAGEIIRIN